MISVRDHSNHLVTKRKKKQWVQKYGTRASKLLRQRKTAIETMGERRKRLSDSDTLPLVSPKQGTGTMQYNKQGADVTTKSADANAIKNA